MKHRSRLTLEPLETRDCPTVFTWQGSGHNWSDAMRWFNETAQAAGQGVPDDNTDTANFPTGAGDIVVNNNYTIKDMNMGGGYTGDIKLNGNVTLTLGNGASTSTLSGSGRIRAMSATQTSTINIVSGTVNNNGPALNLNGDGPMQVYVGGGATLNLMGNTDTIGASIIVGADASTSTINFTNGLTGDITFYNGGGVTVSTNSTLTLSQGVDLLANWSNNSINVAGTVTRPVNTASTIGLNFWVTGTFNMNAGSQLTIDNSDTDQLRLDAGTLNIGDGANLYLGPTANGRLYATSNSVIASIGAGQAHLRAAEVELEDGSDIWLGAVGTATFTLTVTGDVIMADSTLYVATRIVGGIDTSSQLNVMGNLTLNNNNTLIVDCPTLAAGNHTFEYLTLGGSVGGSDGDFDSALLFIDGDPAVGSYDLQTGSCNVYIPV